MSTKKDILQLLESHKNTPLSGASMAEALSVSRTAVWKAINDLRKEGYAIEGTTNRGYRLAPNDILSEEGIRSELPAEAEFHIHVYDTIDSTSNRVKEMAARGAAGNTVVIAETQTAGRGRRGRSFFSPPQSGVYMSVLIRPEESWETPQTAVRLTTAASVAVSRAIEEVTEQRVSIKWVNDLYLEDRKICGILTEGITSMETGSIEAAVIGIGINLYAPAGDFPEELRDKAVSLLPCKDSSASGPLRPSRNQLIAAVLAQLDTMQQDLESKAFISEYKARSCVIGRDIRILSAKAEEDAAAIDIDENGGLVVRTADGTTKTLNSGEITIRWR